MKSEWETKKIGEVVDIRRGSSPRPIHKFLASEGMPWVKIADATSDTSRYIWKTNEFIIDDGVNKSVKVAPETLIVSNSATPGLPKIMKITACVHDGWLVFSNYRGITRDFLYYKFIDIRRQLVNQANGSVFQNLKTDIVKDFDIDIPSIETQKKIVGILSNIDEKIELNNAINNNLEQQAQALFKAWFVDFELNSGIMPSHWYISQLGSVARISTEVFSPSKKPNVEVEHYSIPSYDEKRYPVFESSDGIKSNKYRLTSNSVMISKLNPDTKRIWRPYCISDRPICSTEFIVYEPINPLNRDFIYSIIDSIGFSGFLCSHTTGSTNSRQRATPSITLNFNIVLPDDETIRSFCSIVSPMYDTIENNIKENQKLAVTRDKLLPKLMSGELDVSDIEL